MKKEKVPFVLLIVFAVLVLFTVFGSSGKVFAQENVKKEKSSAVSSSSGEQNGNRNACGGSGFCASIGNCRSTEVQPCSGFGTHVCVTLGNSRYFCHECNGDGECSQNQYCGEDFWFCQKIKDK